MRCFHRAVIGCALRDAWKNIAYATESVRIRITRPFTDLWKHRFRPNYEVTFGQPQEPVLSSLNARRWQEKDGGSRRPCIIWTDICLLLSGGNDELVLKLD